MIRRVLAALALLVCVCSAAFANQEVAVKLNTRDNKVHFARVEGLAYVTFEYVRTEGHNARVRVVVENITNNPPFAVLVFRRETDESFLKQSKPKVEFEKTYPGERGRRRVHGTQEGYRHRHIIVPNEIDTLFTVDVALTSPKRLKLPLYLAKYKARDIARKGKEYTNYKIFEEIILDVDIEVEGWSTDDATYVDMRNKVEQYKDSMRGVTFCPNDRHRPSLEEQQRPYKEKKENLISEIQNILQYNSDWMSTDAPHIAYSGLLSELYDVKLDHYVSDCGNHRAGPPAARHSCGYCSLGAKELYHKLDDTYQRLHAGRITKQEAVKTANALNNCYQKNRSRKKDRFYGGKIAEFHKRIASY